MHWRAAMVLLCFEYVSTVSPSYFWKGWRLNKEKVLSTNQAHYWVCESLFWGGVECEARQRILIREEERSLCQKDVRNGIQTETFRPEQKLIMSLPNICTNLCCPLLFLLIVPLPWPDKSKCGLGSKAGRGWKKKPNYLLAWCLSAKLLIFSTAYFKEASRHSTLWVFTLKLKECFTNWEELVHFN